MDMYAYVLDYEKEPLLKVNTDEKIRINLLNAFNGECGSETELEELMAQGKHHPVYGPIYVNGATPNSSLKINIISIQPSEMAYQCLSRSSGLLKMDMTSRRLKFIRNEKKLVYNEFCIPIRPSIGIVGLANENKTHSGRIGFSGGNIDLAELREGASITLPSSYEGGLVYLGDMHLMQNNGEISGIAAEVSGFLEILIEIVEKRFPFPLIETSDSIIVLGYGENILDSFKCATENAVQYVSDLFNYDLTDSYMYLGVFGELVIGHATGKVVSSGVKIKKEYMLKGEKDDGTKEVKRG